MEKIRDIQPFVLRRMAPRGQARLADWKAAAGICPAAGGGGVPALALAGTDRPARPVAAAAGRIGAGAGRGSGRIGADSIELRPDPHVVLEGHAGVEDRVVYNPPAYANGLLGGQPRARSMRSYRSSKSIPPPRPHPCLPLFSDGFGIAHCGGAVACPAASAFVHPRVKQH